MDCTLAPVTLSPRWIWPAILVLALGLFLGLGLRPAFETEPMQWEHDGARLAGTLYLPRGEGPHPAAVFIHGAGAWTRDETLFRVHAERMARRGLAMLIFDKRGCGESTGDWREASLADLAGDARAALGMLAGDPRIDAARVGYFGTSQGGGVALLAAAGAPSPGFLVTLSLSLRSPAEQETVYVTQRLQAAGASADEVAQAVAISRDIQAAYLDGEGREEVRARLREFERAPWFEESGLRLMPEGSEELRQWLALPPNFDPTPLLGQLDCPVLAAQGEQDLQVPGIDAARELQALASSHPGIWVVLIPGAGHTLRAPRSGVGSGWSWPTAYWEALEAWLDEHVLTREVSAY